VTIRREPQPGPEGVDKTGPNRLGLVKVIEFESGDNRHETNLEPHINLICLSCNSIRDLDIGPLIHVKCARKQLDFTVQDFRLEYYGHCGECAGEPAPRR